MKVSRRLMPLNQVIKRPERNKSDAIDGVSGKKFWQMEKL